MCSRRCWTVSPNHLSESSCEGDVQEVKDHKAVPHVLQNLSCRCYADIDMFHRVFSLSPFLHHVAGRAYTGQLPASNGDGGILRAETRLPLLEFFHHGAGGAAEHLHVPSSYLYFHSSSRKCIYTRLDHDDTEVVGNVLYMECCEFCAATLREHVALSCFLCDICVACCDNPPKKKGKQASKQAKQTKQTNYH